MSLTDFGVVCGYRDPPSSTSPAVSKAAEYMNHARAIAKEFNLDNAYNTEYLVKLIRERMEIFDLRGWPNGINRAEFDRLWEINFEDSWSGHFKYALSAAKRHYRADKEQVWNAIERGRLNGLKSWVATWKKSIAFSIKCMKNAADDRDVETWRGHGIDEWKDLNKCLKELGEPQEPCPSDLTEPCYGDPLTWGE